MFHCNMVTMATYLPGYMSLYYYMSHCNMVTMATYLPGHFCSRLLNVSLSLAVTAHVVNTFRQINVFRLKEILAIILTLLHVLNTAFSIFLDLKCGYEDVGSHEGYVSVVCRDSNSVSPFHHFES